MQVSKGCKLSREGVHAGIQRLQALMGGSTCNDPKVASYQGREYMEGSKGCKLSQGREYMQVSKGCKLSREGVHAGVQRLQALKGGSTCRDPKVASSQAKMDKNVAHYFLKNQSNKQAHFITWI